MTLVRDAMDVLGEKMYGVFLSVPGTEMYPRWEELSEERKRFCKGLVDQLLRGIQFWDISDGRNEEG